MTHYDDQRPEYLAIEGGILSERQRAISASCYTHDNGKIRVLVLYPRGENSQKIIEYEVNGNYAHALDDVFNDSIKLW